MADPGVRKIALVGNPNSGKSSLFNRLTGLSQKIGNFPGVTVDKKTGHALLPNGEKTEIIDLPGTYSVYPNSKDERIVFDILVNKDHPDHPDLVVVVVDASNLKRSLLLFTQIRDLGIPTILVLNMMDTVEKNGMHIDLKKLEERLSAPVIPVIARTGKGIAPLMQAIQQYDFSKSKSEPFLKLPDTLQEALSAVKDRFNCRNEYAAYQLLQQYKINESLSATDKAALQHLETGFNIDKDTLRRKEVLARYSTISEILRDTVEENTSPASSPLTARLDKILTHKVWGYIIFFGLMLLIFQSIFSWAAVPMDIIDTLFSDFGRVAAKYLPDSIVTDLFTEGIIPGIGGIVIFIPQIAILFAFIAILEETGYMSRVVFLTDKLLRKVGLNGRSVVPLVSGVACAIPAIMATRTIKNRKERFITIFVTPFVSCSARIPVYTILIAVVVPDRLIGPFNLQGLVLMGLYLSGFAMAIISAAIMKIILKTRERSFLVMELPSYRAPRWGNIGYTMYEKSKTFVFEAGKIILAISVILWALASYGPGDHLENAEQEVALLYKTDTLSGADFEKKVQAYKLEKSYAGLFGKAIEPAISPLGYDWKIGISLITSFAAREVFVSTMATIYSIGATSEETTIKNRLKKEINPQTGRPRYDLATGMSLLIFYVFAMQCMSTLAVVRRETKSWKWPVVQLLFMTGIAYLSALMVHHLLS